MIYNFNDVIGDTIDDEDYIYTLHAGKVTRTKYESEKKLIKTIIKLYH